MSVEVCWTTREKHIKFWEEKKLITVMILWRWQDSHKEHYFTVEKHNKINLRHKRRDFAPHLDADDDVDFAVPAKVLINTTSCSPKMKTKVRGTTTSGHILSRKKVVNFSSSWSVVLLKRKTSQKEEQNLKKRERKIKSCSRVDGRKDDLLLKNKVTDKEKSVRDERDWVILGDWGGPVCGPVLFSSLYQRSPWGPSSEDPPPTYSLVWFKQAWQQHLEVVSVEGGDSIVQEKKEKKKQEKKEARKWRWLPLKKWVKLSLSSLWTRLYIETQVQALNIPLHNLFVILNHLLSIHERQERRRQ